MWEGNDSMIQQCMRVMEGQSTVNYANSTNCVLTLVSFVCGSTAKAHLFFSFFVCFLCICLLSVKQARTCQQTVLTPPNQPRPRHKLTHTESHLRQHSTASTYKHNSSVTSHSSGTAATLHFILKLTKQQKTAERSYFPFFDRFSRLFSHTASSCCLSFCLSISRSKHLLLSFLSSTVSLAFPPPFLLSCLGMSNYYGEIVVRTRLICTSRKKYPTSQLSI